MVGRDHTHKFGGGGGVSKQVGKQGREGKGQPGLTRRNEMEEERDLRERGGDGQSLSFLQCSLVCLTDERDVIMKRRDREDRRWMEEK